MSEAEHAVGKDTDGKTIYSQTRTFNIGTATTPQAHLATISGATKTWIDGQNTFWLLNGANQRFPLVFFASGALMANVFSIGGAIYYSKPTSVQDLSLIATVRYTK